MPVRVLSLIPVPVLPFFLVFAFVTNSRAGEVAVPIGRSEDSRVVLTRGGEFPGAVAELSNEDEAGNPHWRIRYDLTKGQYFGLRILQTYPEKCDGLAFKIRTTTGRANLFVRTVDSAGQTQQRRIPLLAAVPGTWTETRVNLLKFDHVYPDKNNKEIRWPLKEIAVCFRRDADHPEGIVDFADFRVLCAKASDALAPLAFRLVPDRVGGLYQRGETAAFALAFENISAIADDQLVATDQLFDWRGRLIHTEQTALRPTQATKLDMAPEKRQGLVGAFRLERRLSRAAVPTAPVTGEIWFGILPSAPGDPCPWIGTGLKPGDRQRLDLLTALGIGYVREGLHIPTDPATGRVEMPPDLEAYVDELTRRKIRWNVLLSLGLRPSETFEFPEFARNAGQIAAHFRGRLDDFQVWNEAWNYHFVPRFGMGPDENNLPRWCVKYAELVRLTADAVLRAHPDARVMGTLDARLPQMEAMLKAGIGGRPDTGLLPPNTLALHPYNHREPEPERNSFFRDYGKTYRALCKKYGAPQRLVVTEAGWTTYQAGGSWDTALGHYPPVTYEEQARYIVRMFLASRAAGVPYAIQYNFRNVGPRRDFTEHNFGLVHEDYTPKPSALAVAHLARIVGALEFAEDFATDSDSYRLYHFTDGQRNVLIAHAVEHAAPLEIPFEGDAAEVVDLMGNPVPVEVDGGYARIPLSGNPLYLLNPDIGALRKSSLVDRLSEMPDPATGDIWRFFLPLRNPGRHDLPAGSVTTTFTIPGRDFTQTATTATPPLKAGGAASVELSHTFGKEWDAFRGQPLLVTFDTKVGGAKTTAFRQTKLREPLNLALSDIVFHDDAPAVGVEVAYHGFSPRQLGMKAPAVGFDAEVAVAPGTPQTVWIPVPADIKTISVVGSLDNGSRAEVSGKLRNTVVPGFLALPALDGHGDYFPALLELFPEHPLKSYFLAPGAPRFAGPGDLSARVGIGYTEEGLLVRVQVFDDVVCPPEGAGRDTPWNFDSVQLALAPLEADRMFELSIARSGSETLVIPTRVPEGADASGTRAVVTRIDDTRTVYEAFVPWAAVSLARARPGQRFRFSLLINDNDGKGRKGWLEFHGGIGYGKDPMRFGVYSLGSVGKRRE